MNSITVKGSSAHAVGEKSRKAFNKCLIATHANGASMVSEMDLHAKGASNSEVAKPIKVSTASASLHMF